ncbi:ABC transporter substrate-binding protein [Paenibacillus alginolyticus]|uniref:Iron-siderophore ABC transporter substrate-binding protein n=1 Tax=Paenibacillus alginolyticus TaxID=59839 RepID=A0ABT4GI10_9BACL|nr:iron-siderophore ABC transporter substrate-binding protein [Paenibacillus alginolyticus]MCY9695850.1 iron-siderophore ABC transporter substrate-binding protein [Paenibacillus alginolyticus]MEC0147821.1 iron-siderophore ABC transporter substrate-binding protein [Paenibacillus alginolyticus]
MLVLITIITLILAACGQQTDTSKLNAAATTNTKKESQPVQSEEYTVKHAMGETKIKGTPHKVVVLTNEGTEAVLSMGIKPVGAVKSFTLGDWYDHIKTDMEGVKVVGDENQPNLEMIASLKPDLIIGNKVRQEKVYEQLSAIAPTVFSERLSGDWQINFKLYAEALNKKAEGDKIIGDFEKRITDFKAKAGDKLKTKVSIVRFMPGKVRIYMKDTFSGVILNKLGFQRPASQNQDKFADDLTKERIPDMNGDILFYFTWDNEKGEANKIEQEWTNDPLWKNLDVVKQGKVYKVSDAVWNTAGGIKAANLLLDDLEKYFLKK